MARFLSELVLKELPNKEWELVEPLVYQSDIVGIIIVEKGEHTDLASIPKFLPITKAILNGKGRKAAVVHDHLYREGIGDRATADAVFKEALFATESWVVAWFMWAGVRLGGAFAWRGRPEWPTNRTDPPVESP